jgi:hypothetical protein
MADYFRHASRVADHQRLASGQQLPQSLQPRVHGSPSETPRKAAVNGLEKGLIDPANTAISRSV